MTKETRARINELYLNYQRKRSPNFPEHARLTYKRRDNSANALTQCILDYFKYNGWQAERISTTGRYIDESKVVTDVIGRVRKIGTGKWIPGTGTKGSADISATLPITIGEHRIGLSLKIEVKFGKDKQSADQKNYEEQIKSTGGVYLIARNMDDFINDIDNLIKHYETE